MALAAHIATSCRRLTCCYVKQIADGGPLGRGEATPHAASDKTLQVLLSHSEQRTELGQDETE